MAGLSASKEILKSGDKLDASCPGTDSAAEVAPPPMQRPPAGGSGSTDSATVADHAGGATSTASAVALKLRHHQILHLHQGPAAPRKTSIGSSGRASLAAVSFPDAGEILAQSPTKEETTNDSSSNTGFVRQGDDGDGEDSRCRRVSQSGTSVASSPGWSEAFDADTSASVSPIGWHLVSLFCFRVVNSLWIYSLLIAPAGESMYLQSTCQISSSSGSSTHIHQYAMFCRCIIPVCVHTNSPKVGQTPE